MNPKAESCVPNSFQPIPILLGEEFHPDLRLGLESLAPSNYTTVHLPAALVNSTVGQLSRNAACDIVARALEQPLEDFHKRPSKKFRAQLVFAGYLLGQESTHTTPRDHELCQQLGESLEAIHAGSLIIDDIQDQSAERRGSPSLHKKFGLPLALNAGNWLYFRAFELIRELVASSKLDAKTELRLYRLCHQIMLDAHVGQAIDLGTQISSLPRERVTEVCLASLRLKTGALMALALGSGAVIADANEETLTAILKMGVDLGVCLQMFDDLGNIGLLASDPKRFEDLYLNRPSWIWAAAAQNSGDGEYGHFLLAVKDLPRDKRLIQWLTATELLPLARRKALHFSNSVLSKMAQDFSHASQSQAAFGIIHELLERIQISYG